MSDYRTIQKLIINPADASCDALYYFGNHHSENHSISVDAGGFLLLRSYFNLFSAPQWKEYTVIEQVVFRMELKGEGVAELWKADFNGISERILSIPFCFPERSVLCTEMLRLSDLDAGSWICIRADDEDVILYNCSVLTDAAPTQVPKLALCFCTYKREKELRRNVQHLLSMVQNSGSPLYHAADIFIADNGHTLSKEEFEDNEHVFLFENTNYGGCAGFTRCMIESAINREGQYSHVLLMDDDALIRDYVVERTVSLLSYLKPGFQKHLIGGAHLSDQRPWIQFENGAEFRNRSVRLNGKNVDLRDFHHVLVNQQKNPRLNINYTAWYYACFPASVITKENLPLPLFIHGDDVEYSLRSHFRFIRMNGICVWHPEPDYYRRPHMGYYNHRNFSIIEALFNPGVTARQFMKTELRKIAGLLTEYRTVEALYSMRGVEDFLDGPEKYLAKNHEILNRDIMGWKSSQICQIADIDSCLFAELLEHPRRRYQKILDLLTPARGKRRYYDLSQNTFGSGKVDFRGVKEICFVDPESGKGVLFSKNDPQFKDAIKEWCKLAHRIRVEYSSAAAAWRKKSAELASLPFWKMYLDI